MIRGVEYITVIQDIRCFPIQNYTWSLGEDGYQGSDLLINDGLSACGFQAPEGLGTAELGSGGHSRREGKKGSKIPIVIWVTLEFWKLSG